MVNETNKAHQASVENEQLSQRLAASNQSLANMQAEHRQLLEEMEQLRKRAETLQRIREQQDREEEEKRLEYARAETSHSHIDEESNNSIKNSEQSKDDNGDENDPEEADYIKDKLAEIARLKAQFKRVQHMINTTELIESHISKNQTAESHSSKETANPQAEAENVKNSQTPTTVHVAADAAANSELNAMPNMPTMADLNAATTSDEKEQLILTMLNMFQDFSSDLRSQADNLRAERERIKELKESIIRSRKEQPK